MTTSYYFFVGTVAELIKVMPVMREFRSRGVPFKIIASGQNVLNDDELFETAGLQPVDIVINRHPIRKSVLGLFAWFFTTLFKGVFSLHGELRDAGKETTLVVHGDTLSTVMGAALGRFFGLTVAHIEAGLRSGNVLQPFPEEIDRSLTAFLADIHFAPGKRAVQNLSRHRGEKIDTGFNTNIDSLAFARTQKASPQVLADLKGHKFWIFIMHRQENLLNKALFRNVVQSVIAEARNMKCVFVVHEATMAVLADSGLLGLVEKEPNIHLTGRIGYAGFMSVLEASEYIVTDGGGNQQECYYLGKPCLLLRRVTEGEEGVGGNVVVSGNDLAVIRAFMKEYDRYARPAIEPLLRPSQIIADILTSR